MMNRSHLVRGARVARAALVATIGAVSVALMAPGPAAAEVVQDQSNTGSATGLVAVNSDRDRGQTFVAGVSGQLVSIRLRGCDYADNTTSLTVALYPMSGAVPNSTPDVSGTPLAQQTFTGSSLSFLPPSTACVGDEGADFTITFATPATITAGTAYALTLSASQSSNEAPRGVALSSTDQTDYPLGNRSRTLRGVWEAETTRNLVFTTYVEDNPSASTPTVVLALSESTACRGGNPNGVRGTWVVLPAAGDCEPPSDSPSAQLLGWATYPTFPTAIAQRQVDNGWGAYETFNADGQITGVFIPAGGAAFVSAASTLYPIWRK